MPLDDEWLVNIHSVTDLGGVDHLFFGDLGFRRLCRRCRPPLHAAVIDVCSGLEILRSDLLGFVGFHPIHRALHNVKISQDLLTLNGMGVVRVKRPANLCTRSYLAEIIAMYADPYTQSIHSYIHTLKYHYATTLRSIHT